MKLHGLSIAVHAPGSALDPDPPELIDLHNLGVAPGTRWTVTVDLRGFLAVEPAADTHAPWLVLEEDSDLPHMVMARFGSEEEARAHIATRCGPDGRGSPWRLYRTDGNNWRPVDGWRHRDWTRPDGEADP